MWLQVIVGSVAARVNTFSFAKPALDELEAIIPVFEMSQAHPIPRNSLVNLVLFEWPQLANELAENLIQVPG